MRSACDRPLDRRDREFQCRVAVLRIAVPAREMATRGMRRNLQFTACQYDARLPKSRPIGLTCTLYRPHERGGRNLAGCGKSRSVLFSEQSVPLSVAVTH